MQRRPARYGDSEDTELVIVLDCVNLDRASAFWCGALGYVGPPPEWQSGSGSYRQFLPADGDGIELLLQQVSEGHSGKNRVRQTDEPVQEHGWTWHVLSDPDGNELCVLEPPL
ncbi:MAG: VOC family protein [Actinomycetota bacterium]|nr:VOC family protein [Actinomycetota bacterium]